MDYVYFIIKNYHRSQSYLRIILAWIDGGAIFIAVALITLVGSIVDYRKEKQFQKMNAYANAKKIV